MKIHNKEATTKDKYILHNFIFREEQTVSILACERRTDEIVLACERSTDQIVSACDQRTNLIVLPCGRRTDDDAYLGNFNAYEQRTNEFNQKWIFSG